MTTRAEQRFPGAEERCHAELKERELIEALKQQAATSDILRLISTSPTDVRGVFSAIVQNAVSLCGSLFANVFRFDGELLHYVTSRNVGPEYAELMRAKYPMRPDASQVSGRVLLTRSVVRLEDAIADPEYDQRFPRAFGWRRMLGVPMLRDGNPIGVIVVGWAEPGPISRVQEELLKTFADQAVIAIENARLFDEVQARTRELSEALEYQTATGDVLNVISRSPTQLQPVLDTIVNTAARLCAAEYSYIAKHEDNTLRFVAHVRVTDAHVSFLADPISVDRGAVIGRVVLEKRTVHVADVLVDPEFDRFEWQHVGKQRTVLGVPLLRQGTLIGVLILARTSVAPFTGKQIELVTTFADQAVIAIENARLFDELQARTRELSGALQEQTATADVLKAMSRSAFDLQTVLNALVQAAARLGNADHAWLFLREDEAYRWAASYGHSQEEHERIKEFMLGQRILPGRGTLIWRTALEGRPVQFADARTDPEYEWDAAQQVGNYRTTFGAPLLRDGVTIGVLALMRAEVKPFNDKEIRLSTSFADQAVIAIENARLVNQTREALEQQTATAEILRVIASSPSDVQPVFDAILESATRLCDAQLGGLYLVADGVWNMVAFRGEDPSVKDVFQNLRPGPDTGLGRLARQRAPVHIHDLQADVATAQCDPVRIATLERLRPRTFLAVPLLKEDTVLGAVIIYRRDVRPFTEPQIALVSTFADQAAIGIENVRLFNETNEALQYQTATSEVLNVISRSPTELQPVLDAIVQTAARLCSAEYSFITRYDNGRCRLVAANRMDAAHSKYLSKNPVTVDRGSVTGRVVIDKKAHHVADVLADPEFDRLAWQKVGKQRTVLGVPLMREGNLIGAMMMARTAVAPFTEKQIELVTTFADQAVIAIENARLFDEIQEKRRQLEIADKYKSHFLASASHDLRQPLHALNLFVAQLQAEADPAERERLVTRIDAAVVSMNELFESLLDMAKLEAGILEPHLADFPVQRVFRHIETTFADAAKQKELRLSVVPSSAWIRSDVILFERMLMNLVSNAVRYTTSGGIVVGCRRRGAYLRIDVCDSGPGIPEEQHQSIFAEYYRLAAAEPERGGFGLGLAIVDRLGRLLGHRVELVSRPGQGARFSICAPLAKEHPAAVEVRSICALPDPARGKLVLVIDDDPLVLEGMGGMLRSWGCLVMTADSEEAALTATAAREQPPDLIISDYRLANGRTGIHATERLRSAFGVPIPAFLISGDTAPERLRDASESGFHLLHKPVAPMRLRAVLNQLLRTPTERAIKPVGG